MSVKVALLKSGESVIADLKELVLEDKVCGYLFKNPYIVTYSPKQMFLSEEVSSDSEVNVHFNPWIPFTSDKEVPVSHDWLVSIVNPLNDITALYEEMLNGQDGEVSSTEE